MTLFGRQGCHLCDAMLAALKPCLVAGKVTLQMVDVDGEPDLKARFDTEVPLLFEGELEICRHQFNRLAFEAWLRAD